MPRIVKPLTAIEIPRIVHPEGKARPYLHPVGTVAGLYLQTTAGGGKSWLLRVQVGIKRREIGLGAFPTVTLAEAWAEARKHKSTIKSGRDPIEERARARTARIEEQRRHLTFEDALARYIETGHLDGLKTEKQRTLWRSIVETYAMKVIRTKLVEDVTVEDVKAILSPIWRTKTETARKLKLYIAAIFDWAINEGARTDRMNPASGSALKGAVAQWNKGAKKRGKRHQPTLAVNDVPAWFAALRTVGGNGARALEFACLTAARSGEVRGMTWAEIDRDARIWSLAPDRMKGGEFHRVPLSDAAMALLDALPRRAGVDYVFPAPRDGMLSDMTLSATMRRMQATAVDAGRTGWLDPVTRRPAVPHGLRAAFKGWARTKTTYDQDMSEMALAHKVGSEAQQAYEREDMLERRRDMMADWAAWCEGKSVSSDNVIQLRRGA